MPSASTPLLTNSTHLGQVSVAELISSAELGEVVLPLRIYSIVASALSLISIAMLIVFVLYKQRRAKLIQAQEEAKRNEIEGDDGYIYIRQAPPKFSPYHRSSPPHSMMRTAVPQQPQQQAREMSRLLIPFQQQPNGRNLIDPSAARITLESWTKIDLDGDEPKISTPRSPGTYYYYYYGGNSSSSSSNNNKTFFGLADAYHAKIASDAKSRFIQRTVVGLLISNALISFFYLAENIIAIPLFDSFNNNDDPIRSDSRSDSTLLRAFILMNSLRMSSFFSAGWWSLFLSVAVFQAVLGTISAHHHPELNSHGSCAVSFLRGWFHWTELFSSESKVVRRTWEALFHFVAWLTPLALNMILLFFWHYTQKDAGLFIRFMVATQYMDAFLMLLLELLSIAVRIAVFYHVWRYFRGMSLHHKSMDSTKRKQKQRVLMLKMFNYTMPFLVCNVPQIGISLTLASLNLNQILECAPDSSFQWVAFLDDNQVLNSLYYLSAIVFPLQGMLSTIVYIINSRLTR